MAKNEIVNNDALTIRVADEGLIETVVDNAEQAVDLVENTVERVVTITKNNPFLIVGALVVGASIGGYVGWKISEKRTVAKYELILEEEIAAAKKFYKRLVKEGEFETPESAVEALIPSEAVSALNTYQGREKATPYNKPELIVEETPDVVVENVEVTNNVFVDARTDPRDWDYQQEVANRDTSKPYVISFEEFNENEEGHEQVTLAYFVTDDTLADEKDSPIDNTDYTVGDDNLLRFGHGSQDKNVVYIRNERLDMDFEVIRSGRSFKEDVLGLDPEPEIRHSYDRRARRGRRGADE